MDEVIGEIHTWIEDWIKETLRFLPFNKMWQQMRSGVQGRQRRQRWWHLESDNIVHEERDSGKIKKNSFPFLLPLAQMTVNGPIFCLLSNTFFTKYSWYLINAHKIWFLACHFPDQRLLMTPLPPHLSKIVHTVFLHLLSQLNLIKTWEALKSPPHTSPNWAQVSTLLVLHIFLPWCLRFSYLFIYFLSTLNVPTNPSIFQGPD